MKHSYISNTFWHTNTVVFGDNSQKRCHWEIVNDDYLYSYGLCDIQSYKIIRNEK